MKNLKLAIVAMLVGVTANAAVRPYYQDVKFPTQKMVEYQQIVNPAAAGTADILSAHAGATSAAAASATSFVAQPDVPRNVVITPGGTTGDVEACAVTVTGTNFFGTSMSETLNFAANASSAQTGILAFKTISSVAWAANCESGGFAATWSVGYGEKLGLKRCMDQAGHVLGSTVSGAWEATRPTVAKGSSVQGNTADFNGTMDGAADFEIFFFQNFTCLP